MKLITKVSEIEDILKPVYKISKKGKQCFSDTIYTFDIEVSSLFNINNKWQVFDYSIPAEDYREIDKASCVYVSMFGINDKVYYFRDFMLFEEILKHISDMTCRKIVYVHNLAYEMQFCRMFLGKYTISNVLASAPHKPISFTIDDLNIEFRCSYRLTGLSLAKSAEKYTTLKKASGDLDYNKARSPLTKLTNKELHYCEYDIVTLYHIIKWFRTEYKHVYNIPLTQTGEVRRELRDYVDYWYFKRQQELVPDMSTYLYLMQAFQGGITHANILYSNRVLKNVWTVDEASAYPTMMLTKKFPSGKWYDYRYIDFLHMRDMKCFLLHIRITGLKSKLFNHYLSSYKCLRQLGVRSDNGRIVKADMIEIIVTDVDYDMILRSYNFDDIEFIKIMGSDKKYLDKRILKYILKLYKQKTELKGVEGQEEFYYKSKQRINSLYGCSCTQVLNQDTYFIDNEWGRYCEEDIKGEFIVNKLNELRNSYSILFNYGVGVWVTAYNRATLWSQILQNDINVVYYDTDSIKTVKQIDFSAYNDQIIAECKASADANGLNIDDFAPADQKGIQHQIGVFESEGCAEEFITLGAKKYCYRKNGELHITVSGVPKQAVDALEDDINNFKDTLVFDYAHARKNTHFYTIQEPFTFTDIDGNEYTCKDSFGIVLQPTTYKLGLTDEYLNIINEYQVTNLLKV